MTEFKDAVEKQRGLQAYQEWASEGERPLDAGTMIFDCTQVFILNYTQTGKGNEPTYTKPQPSRRYHDQSIAAWGGSRGCAAAVGNAAGGSAERFTSAAGVFE